MQSCEIHNSFEKKLWSLMCLLVGGWSTPSHTKKIHEKVIWKLAKQRVIAVSQSWENYFVGWCNNVISYLSYDTMVFQKPPSMRNLLRTSNASHFKIILLSFAFVCPWSLFWEDAWHTSCANNCVENRECTYIFNIKKMEKKNI